MSAILKCLPLEMFWPTFDPFLFCAFHNDHYPKGKADLSMEPDASLAGRSLGSDFSGIDGWRMYHGSSIPGFPAHPHRGFETVTIVNKGFVDHADSAGASGRYGEGDTQWMTAGSGLQHSEMFPLLNTEDDNPLEMFQLWLNLPSKSKMVPPNFTMLWNETTPMLNHTDQEGHEVKVKIIAGTLEGTSPAPCAPNSWAADQDNHVAIWLIDLEENATWTLPPAIKGINRTLYFYEGSQLQLDGQQCKVNQGFVLQSDAKVTLQNTGKKARLLLLQGRPINEHVEKYGPFVMNTRAELQQAFTDFKRTQFGGWPWPRMDQVHDRTAARFAHHGDKE